MHKIELRPKDPTKASTGANTQLFLDGNLLQGIMSCNIDVKAGGVATIKLEMIGNVEVSVLGELETQVLSVKLPENN